MKEIIGLFAFMLALCLIGGLHVFGKITDAQASLLFIGTIATPFGIKLLFLPRKKQG